jgi:type VI secretion system protein ImpC
MGEKALKTLLDQALADTSLVKTDVRETIGEMIAQLDKKLSEQMNKIMHAPEFQQIESAWRGLKYLLFQSETGAMLKIRVLNVTKDELYWDLLQSSNAGWDESPLFKKIIQEQFGRPGGEPYGCLVGDYYFDHSPTDVQLLRDLSRIAAAAHAPLFAAVDSKLLRMNSWIALGYAHDLSELFGMPEYAAWNALRESEDARYVGLCMPRVLARLPFGTKGEPVDEFAFEEDTDGVKGEKYSWMNAAYAMAANINRAFTEFGWCARIRGWQSGGVVDGLPSYAVRADDGSAVFKSPLEIAVTERHEAQLARSGLIPLFYGTHRVAFLGAQSLFRPRVYQDNPQATAASNLAARLPLTFACCRFAHYLNVMVRNNLGYSYEKEQLQTWLSNWIREYVDEDPKNSSEDDKCRRPLAGAKIALEESAGYYLATFELRPHFQLEAMAMMDIRLALVSRLPRVTAAR